MRVIGLCLVGALLSGCAATQPGGTHPLELRAIDHEWQRSFYESPFARGPVTVLAPVGGDLLSYELRPCRGDSVCGTRAGRYLVTHQYDVVHGAYPGTTFYLSPGGDGVARIHGHAVIITWK